MKRLLLSMFTASFTLTGFAQADSVSIGAGYQNQVWYSLSDGVQKEQDKANWDIAFEVNGFTSSIRINHVGGTEVWRYPNADTSGWGSVDTTGIANWDGLINSDTSWSIGALNTTADPSNAFDQGWGTYNMTTHHVTSDSFHIIKTTSGDYQKFWVESLIGGTYTFRLADLDGNNEITRTITKTDYTDKNFGYYAIDADEFRNREPNYGDWDLLFTQYAAIIPNYGSYNSTGVLQNKSVLIAEITEADTSSDDYASASFQTAINMVGYQWKSINFVTYQWDIQDSLVYFVKRQADETVWKLIMTGFGGSSNGNYYFTRELLSDTATGVEDNTASDIFLNVFPNPASSIVNLVMDVEDSEAEVSIFSMNGTMVDQRVVTSGFQQLQYNVSGFSAGVYFVTVKTADKLVNSKFIIQ